MNHPSTKLERGAVVLLSGGLDSATTLAIARADGFSCHAITFDYGQRHRVELAAARRVAASLDAASHRCVHIDLTAFEGLDHSALMSETEVPKDRNEREMAAGIPVTYVPARNTIFLSYALALAELLECAAIYLGVNAVDYSGYPDCRPQYIDAFEKLAELATKSGVEGQILRIVAPLLHWQKTRIIQRGVELGVDYRLTHSCYDPAADGSPCTRCDSCVLRQNAFVTLGMRDPLLPSEALPRMSP